MQVYVTTHDRELSTVSIHRARETAEEARQSVTEQNRTHSAYLRTNDSGPHAQDTPLGPPTTNCTGVLFALVR